MSIQIIKRFIKRWGPLVVLGALMAAAFAAGLHEKISLHVLQNHKETMLSAVAERPLFTALIFVVVYVVFVALSLPAATLLTLTGGFLFGPWLGTFYVVTAATIGATIIFFVARTSLGAALREKAGGLYTRIEGNMNENAGGYLLFMRLVPLFPFFLVNIVPALFNVKARTYILTTFFGIIPGSFVYVNLGGQLADIESLKDLVSGQTLLAFGLLGVFALIPTLYKQLRKAKGGVVVLLLVSLLTTTPSYAGRPYDRFLALYDGLLELYLHPALKDGIAYHGLHYDGWAADGRHKETLALLLAENPKSLAGDAKKAFWINAYNVLTIDLIVREGERKSIKNLGSLFTSPWKRYQWMIGGKNYTLDEIEHKILRPLGDPRIHFAINCASVSCPDLRGEVYRATALDRQLDEQVRAALGNPGKGLRVEGDVLYVSKIFDWFGGDFKGGDVKGWLGAYVKFAPKASIKFMDYDWSLNKAN